MNPTRLAALLVPAKLVAVPRPPRGPGDDDGDQELPMGDPPDTDETDDPSDEDEGEEDDVPLRGLRPAARLS